MDRITYRKLRHEARRARRAQYQRQDSRVLTWQDRDNLASWAAETASRLPGGLTSPLRIDQMDDMPHWRGRRTTVHGRVFDRRTKARIAGLLPRIEAGFAAQNVAQQVAA